MEDAEMRETLARIERKAEAAAASAEKARRYLLAIMIGSAVAFVLPLVGLLFAIPSLLSTYAAIGAF